MLKSVQAKNLSEISREWDETCKIRQQAINNNQDISLLSVTAPCIINEIKAEHPNSVIDVGCGTGYLTYKIKENVEHCVGIDASAESIVIANKYYKTSGLHFITSAFDRFNPEQHFDLCVSNMALTCDPDIDSTLSKMYRVLNKNGKLLIMITHPFFWPKYWGYQDESWFDYSSEQYIEHDFSISFVKSMGKSTYIHRPLSQYVNAIVSAGFSIEKIDEPYPTGDIPADYRYDYPRFLLFKCTKADYC